MDTAPIAAMLEGVPSDQGIEAIKVAAELAGTLATQAVAESAGADWITIFMELLTVLLPLILKLFGG